MIIEIDEAILRGLEKVDILCFSFLIDCVVTDNSDILWACHSDEPESAE